MASTLTKTITTILVTGGNNGIGLETCKLLSAQPSTHIILASRSRAKGDAASQSITAANPDASISVVELDITSDTSISSAVEAVQSQHEHLDVLVNNAGICPLDFTRQSLTESMITNAISPPLVTAAFLPLLLRSPDPRIIYVSTGLSSISRLLDSNKGNSGQSYAAYRASKTALNMLAACDAVQLKGKAKVWAYCPGYVVTDLAGMRAAKVEQGVAKGADTSARGILAIVKGERDGEVTKLIYGEGGSESGVYGW